MPIFFPRCLSAKAKFTVKVDFPTPPLALETIKTKLSFGMDASQASEIILYPDTPHAFHADYRPSYRKQQAEDGWKRCLAWFAKTLKA